MNHGPLIQTLSVSALCEVGIREAVKRELVNRETKHRGGVGMTCKVPRAVFWFGGHERISNLEQRVIEKAAVKGTSIARLHAVLILAAIPLVMKNQSHVGQL